MRTFARSGSMRPVQTVLSGVTWMQSCTVDLGAALLAQASSRHNETLESNPH
jgi:hypothetical protein